MGDGAGEPSGDELVAAFARWAADERVAEAAQRRSRERWLRQQASEDATLAGVLTDLAERRAEVVLSTRTRREVGRVVGVARDFCVLEERSGTGMLVALGGLVALGQSAAPGGSANPDGDRPAPLPVTLADALAMLAADRSPVRLAVSNGDLMTGTVAAIGHDFVTLRGDAHARGNGPGRHEQLYVPLDAIEVCTPA